MSEVVDLHMRITIAFEAVSVVKACPCFDFRLQLRQHHCCLQGLHRFIEGSFTCVAVNFERSVEVVPRVEDPETTSGGADGSCEQKCPSKGGLT